MKKGFTLVELVVVILIVGILASLALTQYGAMIERSRGAEAKAILGTLRKYAATHYMEFGGLGAIGGTSTAQGDFSDAKSNIGTGSDQIPSACALSHYFQYSISGSSPSITMTATRCASGGKLPQGNAADSLTLISDLSTGVDSWGGSGRY